MKEAIHPEKDEWLFSFMHTENMKNHLLIFPIIFVCNIAYAFPGLSVTSPDETRLAAKYAKQKAKISADNTFIAEDEIARNTDGCDLNIGNLSIADGVTDVPNELIVIIEGDVIQANECKTH